VLSYGFKLSPGHVRAQFCAERMKKYGFKEMDGHPVPFRMFGNWIKTV